MLWEWQKQPERQYIWWQGISDKHATIDVSKGKNWKKRGCGCYACNIARATGYMPILPEWLKNKK